MKENFFLKKKQWSFLLFTGQFGKNQDLTDLRMQRNIVIMWTFGPYHAAHYIFSNKLWTYISLRRSANIAPQFLWMTTALTDTSSPERANVFQIQIAILQKVNSGSIVCSSRRAGSQRWTSTNGLFVFRVSTLLSRLWLPHMAYMLCWAH